jgi:hypothetical protein
MRAVCSTVVLAAVAAGVTPPGQARAQTIPSPYAFVEERQEVGLYAGYMSASSGRFGYGPAGGAMFGGRYGVELAGPLSLEGLVGVVSGTRDIISPARPEGDRAVGEAAVRLGVLDVRLKLSATGARTWHGLSPFVVFGGGAAYDMAPEPAADALLEPDEVFQLGTKFVGVAGAGVRWFLTRRFALRTDGTLFLWKIRTPSGFGDAQFGFGPVAESEWVRGLSLSASLLFRW